MFAVHGRYEMQLLCRDATKTRDFQVEAGTRVTSNPNDIINDDDIDIVVEVMGGSTTALDLARAAAGKKQHFVTANKAMVANEMKEMDKLFGTHDKPTGSFFGYEAAVAGGVPVIRVMRDSLLCDNVTSVAGIMNGTTNYILTQMSEQGLTYAAALKAAQDVGFAEADPSADVEGVDARNKLIILSRLAFGVTVPGDLIPTTGIATVSAADFAIAQDFGYTIKLLGVAELADSSKQSSDNSSDTGSGASEVAMDCFVCPALVPGSSHFASTSGGRNLIEVRSEAVGTSRYYGPGAGRHATANSVIADMVAIANGTMGAAFPRPPPAFQVRLPGDSASAGSGSQFKRSWYYRGPSKTVEAVKRKLAPEQAYKMSKPWNLDAADFERGIIISDVTRREMEALVTAAAKPRSRSPSPTSTASDASSTSAERGSPSAADYAGKAYPGVLFPVYVQE